MQFNTPYGLADDQSASYLCGLEEGLAIGAITGGVNSGIGGGGGGGSLETGTTVAVSNVVFQSTDRTVYQHTGYPNGGIHFTPIEQLTSFFGSILGEGGSFSVSYNGRDYTLYGGRFKNSAIEILMGMVDRRNEHKWDLHPDWLWSGGDYMKVTVGERVVYHNLGYGAAFSNWNYTHNGDDTYDHHWAKVKFGDYLLVERKTSSPGALDLMKIIPIQDKGYYFYCTGIFNGYVDNNGNSASVKCDTKIASATNDSAYATKYLNSFMSASLGEEHKVYNGYFISNGVEQEIEGAFTPMISLRNKGSFLIAQSIDGGMRQGLIKLLDNLVLSNGDGNCLSEYDNVISATLNASYIATEGGE